MRVRNLLRTRSSSLVLLDRRTWPRSVRGDTLAQNGAPASQIAAQPARKVRRPEAPLSLLLPAATYISRAISHADLGFWPSGGPHSRFREGLTGPRRLNRRRTMALP